MIRSTRTHPKPTVAVSHGERVLVYHGADVVAVPAQSTAERPDVTSLPNPGAIDRVVRACGASAAGAHG